MFDLLYYHLEEAIIFSVVNNRHDLLEVPFVKVCDEVFVRDSVSSNHDFNCVL